MSCLFHMCAQTSRMAFQLGSAALAEPGALVVHGAVSWLKWSSNGMASQIGAAALAEPGAEAADAAASAQVTTIPLGPFWCQRRSLRPRLTHAHPHVHWQSLVLRAQRTARHEQRRHREGLAVSMH